LTLVAVSFLYLISAIVRDCFLYLISAIVRDCFMVLYVLKVSGYSSHLGFAKNNFLEHRN